MNINNLPSTNKKPKMDMKRVPTANPRKIDTGKADAITMAKMNTAPTGFSIAQVFIIPINLWRKVGIRIAENLDPVKKCEPYLSYDL